MVEMLRLLLVAVALPCAVSAPAPLSGCLGMYGYVYVWLFGCCGDNRGRAWWAVELRRTRVECVVLRHPGSPTGPEQLFPQL